MKHSFVHKMLILTALLFLFVMAKPAAAFADGSDEAGNAEPTGVEEIGEHYGSRVTEQREKTVAQTNRKEVTVTLYLLKDGNKVLITRYYIDEMHLLLKEEQTAAYTVEIWKRFRKWGGIPTGITQNVKDLLSSREVENIFENSDFVYMLNQAGGDRQILARQLGISPHQLSYVTHSGEGEGLLFYGSTILPFVDHFPKNTELYKIMTTKLSDLSAEAKEG